MGVQKQKGGENMASVLTNTSAEKARRLLDVLDMIHENPPQYLKNEDVDLIFDFAANIRLQLARLEK